MPAILKEIWLILSGYTFKKYKGRCGFLKITNFE
ncbi:hypothetical protein C8N40_103126 [Pontibacter mucosus]|uniref:Uncharacterized protein n=1 Tax=Pontibacter mucosus TaxID=1649266 RepID=A0A2T5YL74_9BACT|nr:hypothetical protein C8N40_103126 [Pontibacter mucosus]